MDGWMDFKSQMKVEKREKFLSSFCRVLWHISNSRAVLAILQFLKEVMEFSKHSHTFWITLPCVKRMLVHDAGSKMVTISGWPCPQAQTEYVFAFWVTESLVTTQKSISCPVQAKTEATLLICFKTAPDSFLSQLSQPRLKTPEKTDSFSYCSFHGRVSLW